MSQSEWLAAMLIAGFIVWLAMGQRLGVYWSVLTGGAAAAAGGGNIDPSTGLKTAPYPSPAMPLQVTPGTALPLPAPPAGATPLPPAQKPNFFGGMFGGAPVCKWFPSLCFE